MASLNCAGGLIEAAREVIPHGPDLVLQQESPSRPEVEKLAAQLYGKDGAWVWGPDASIVARGKLDQVALGIRSTDVTAAEWTALDGQKYKVASLRLAPPVLRIDLWNPAAWQDYLSNRRARIQQLQDISRRLPWDPDIIGGDFNIPPDPQGSPVTKSREHSLADAFAVAGRGWGATCVNPLPLMVRIDRIYADFRRLAPVTAFAAPSVHSDHRIVIADYAFQYHR